MDQYVISFNFDMLYFDMIELIHVMKESKNEAIEPYIESLQKIVDDQTKEYNNIPPRPSRPPHLINDRGKEFNWSEKND